MFKNIKDQLLAQEDEDFLEKLGDGINILNKDIDPVFLYFESVRNNDLEMIKLLLYSNSVDVNYRFRFNKEKRVSSDMIPLKEAINSYSFDVAEFLIKAGHSTEDFSVVLYSSDADNLYYESYHRAIEFCENHNIDYYCSRIL